MANTAKSMIDKGRTQLGYREGRNNWTKYPPEVPGLAWAQNQPWCQTWISWLAVKTGNKDVIPLTASCLTCTNWFKSRGQFHRSGPKPGDLVMYGANGGTHVDMVTEVSGSRIRVIGGNTGGSYNGQYFNGDGVYEKWTDISNSRIHGFARPKYKAGSTNETGVLPDTGGGQKPPTKGKFTVKKGMTLLGICAILGVSLAELLTANPQVKDPNRITEGQELNVPDKKGTQKPPTKEPTKEPSKKPTTEPTKEPSKKPEVKPSEKPKPGHKPDPSTGGQGKPVVPAKPGTEKPNQKLKTYTVKKGDTLGAIAIRHGISLQKLLDMNKGRFPNPDRIFPGQHVNLDGTKIVVPDTVNKVTPCSCQTNHQTKPSKPVPAKPVSPAPVISGVSLGDVMPTKPPVVQRGWDRPLNAAELANARVIYSEAVKLFGSKDGARAAVIGIATAYQESRLQNLQGGHLDSAGLFQQRPSMGWGTHAQVTNPAYAANKFFTTMKQSAPGWKSMPLWEASHKVQRSGSPMAPAAFELAAAKLVVQFSGGKAADAPGKHRKPYDATKDRPQVQEPAPKPVEQKPVTPAVRGWVKPVQAAAGTPFGQKGSMWSSGYHTGQDFPAPQGTPIVAAGTGQVVEAGWAGAYGQSVVIQHENGVKTRYAHMSAISVRMGQTVQAGAQIGNVGSTGNSTGAHLHLEFIANGVQVDPMRYLGG
ncbi:peptidoglycan DD-metalloendopeptidase family protein [Streptomyces narbonensis]|uniref:peptidoglycan DD-metalloendopeptidase family protein n=1 Tax=Streptomyces narbonensis TaxID=67333 RepID=UPI0033CBE601